MGFRFGSRGLGVLGFGGLDAALVVLSRETLGGTPPPSIGREIWGGSHASLRTVSRLLLKSSEMRSPREKSVLKMLARPSLLRASSRGCHHSPP